MSEREILSNYVYTIVSSLVTQGVEQVVVSPGSRSTPLAYAFAHTKEVEMFRQVDERAAGFFALGLAKASAKPVVLLCTSGTAAANYYPAIVEAKYARVPLIVITADRPHELREVGAPQTINQIQLYGEQVKWYAEFPIPDESSLTLPFVERHVARGVAIAMAAPFGPVHFNVPFREPLLIDFTDLPKQTFTPYFANDYSISPAANEMLQHIVNSTQKGLLVVGELALKTDMKHVWQLVCTLKWPTIIESLSGMRGNVPSDCEPYIVSTYDAILKNKAFKKLAAPQTVIRLGAQPVSKFLTTFITASQPEHYIVIDEDPMFRDSTHMTTAFIHARVNETLQIRETAIDAEYTALWYKANAVALEQITQYIKQETEEGALVGTMLEHLPTASTLFVSSSMPIRDVDTFYRPSEKDLHIVANRGANGIDGVISTAFGYSAANRSRYNYLVIGDLAFLHDSNAFLATRYQALDLTVVVMNNDGGGIFSYLPQSTVEKHYEDLFGTPTGLTLEHHAQMYELPYVKVDTKAQLIDAIQPAKGVRIIEVFTDRAENVTKHRALWQAIHKELDECL